MLSGRAASVWLRSSKAGSAIQPPLLDLQQPQSKLPSSPMSCMQDGTCGAPLIVTAGGDGGVRAWDPRQPQAPAAAFLPEDGSARRDCWCVAVGNAYSTEAERCVLAGYENGDLKMFDLRHGGGAAVRWQTNVGKGVCGVQVSWGLGWLQWASTPFGEPPSSMQRVGQGEGRHSGTWQIASPRAPSHYPLPLSYITPWKETLHLPPFPPRPALPFYPSHLLRLPPATPSLTGRASL